MDKVCSQLWVYAELDRIYPSVLTDQKADNVRLEGDAGGDSKADNVRPAKSQISTDGQIQGLNEIPDG